MNAHLDTLGWPEHWQAGDNPAYGESYVPGEWDNEPVDDEGYEAEDCFAESAEEYQRGWFD